MKLKFANSGVYYGLSLMSGDFEQPIHIAFIISGLVEIIGTLVAIPVTHFIGRKYPICSAMLLGGIFLLITVFLSDDTVIFILAMIGKLSISVSFIMIWLYTGELFPTSVRNSVVGGASFFGRFGSALSPAVAYSAKTHKTPTIIVLGCISFSAGLVALLLPETKNAHLPDTVDED
ncbi:DgyrCDS10183 [Dimorphilus gyrociliatus]|uniref:DgyrCDS10183 n=1 Tax=Dimorphilus gyrociliatus TaxID=2664684 RepID=A0A7I8VZD1_9ANNE|nr:DgyrCDS10183 [Dimorphilus gyrociliatus]